MHTKRNVKILLFNLHEKSKSRTERESEDNRQGTVELNYYLSTYKLCKKSIRVKNGSGYSIFYAVRKLYSKELR